MSGKRHVKQSPRQRLGQFCTENAAELLGGFEPLVSGKTVIDPFAGDCHLVNWAFAHGALSAITYDIAPKSSGIAPRDSILSAPIYTDRFLVSNPPYLSRNKNKDKTAYDIWKQDDLYKCHLASLYPTCKEGILILPSNFISESRANARRLFFRYYSIGRMKYFYYQVFPSTTTGIVVFDFYLDMAQPKAFDAEIHYKDRIVCREILLEEKYNYLFGAAFFDYIADPHPLKVTKFDTTAGSPPNTNIVIGLLSYGAYALGAHYNSGSPLVCQEKAFTTYQVSIDAVLSEHQQKQIVERYNERLRHYVQLYDGLFLANYMGAEQKIKSRHYSNMLLSRVTKEVLTGVVAS